MRNRTVAHRILLVHEDPAAARKLSARLTSFGYGIAGVSADPGADGVLRSRKPADLALVSLALATTAEGARGVEEIRRQSIPVVYLTAGQRAPALKRAGVTGPFGYVAPPYSERELRMNIEMALVTKAMTTRAHELEDRFFTVSIDLLCFLDFSGYFKRLNPAWEQTLGFTREELMSKPFIEFVHPDDRARTLEQNRAVRDGGASRAFENRYVCRDGSYRWLLWNAAPDIGQRVIYSVARDITDRKNAEDERERMLTELRAALAEVKTLQEILPMCSYCRKIRDDENYWQSVEAYIAAHTNATFSHGICPSCYEREVAPQFERRRRVTGVPRPTVAVQPLEPE